MKVIKRGLTILEAKVLADKLALETGSEFNCRRCIT